MLALRLPLRVAVRVAAPTHARLAAPVVASSLSISRSYRLKANLTEEEKAAAKQAKSSEKKAAKSSEQKAAKPPAKNAPKVLTQEQKDKLAQKAKATKDKEDLKMLKAQALSPPLSRAISMWPVYVREQSPSKSPDVSQASFVKQLAADFKNLPEHERETYAKLATEATVKNTREFEEWLNQHTPAQIFAANQARAQLRKRLPGSKQKYLAIKDDRLVKRVNGSFFMYHSERTSSNDFQGLSTNDKTKKIAEEWRALSASEKKKYEDLAAEDTERYAKEFLEIYGFEAPFRKASANKSTAGPV